MAITVFHLSVDRSVQADLADCRGEHSEAVHHTVSQQRGVCVQADLAGKDFRGERSEAVVITTGVVTTLDAERAAEERAVSQARHAHKLALPRRPTWSREMSAEQIHEQEAAMFLRWRRALAECAPPSSCDVS